eukprot:TRINITY_DN26236_c0_g1_i4.p1 TRINITY_DN26236_c0_g1~~TRINITY_DN26236_c0_g1_i4.p1  ORF type:complete len:347 (+),score=69.56 TRINITY_DN26236_c0_g1_i4:286-1326(+)
MGTHCNGPADALLEPSMPLTDVLLNHPDMMEGYPLEYAQSKATGELPYLFKILSVAKALSIQAHPDKCLAERIHGSHPELYKDPNHKPEMALALTQMEALCQFRAPAEIVQFLQTEPEFRALCGETEAQALEDKANPETPCTDELKHLFGSFMRRDQDMVEQQLGLLLDRLSALDQPSDTQQLIQRLSFQYPGDIGCFCPFLLNYVTLQPGEAMFLAANEPHAYLSGDLAECMACSDNVIRSGLTPKFKDVDLLCECLTYQTGAAPIERGQQVDQHTRLFTPPVPEFEMIITSLGSCDEYLTSPNHSPMLTVVVEAAEATVCTEDHPEPLIPVSYTHLTLPTKRIV